MVKSGEFTGHSIDEAVFHGLQELGLSIDEVSIETLQTETKGLFGIGAKLARVRLTQREAVEVVKTPQAAHETQRTARPAYDDRSPRGNGPRKEPYAQSSGPRREPYSQSSGPRKEPYAQGSGPRREPYSQSSGPRRDFPPRDRYDEAPRPQYNYSAELAKTDPAAVFLAGLLRRMGIEGEVLAVETEDGLRLRIDSQTRGLLIGRRGETLDALQYITSLHLNRDRKQEKYLRVTLDTEDYRSKREDTLSRLARRQAARVKASGRPVTMEPMSPYERRVLHASLQNSPYVTTHSEGEEPNRHVVIAPKR